MINNNSNADVIPHGDTYRTMKCQLTSIIRDQNDISLLFDATLRTHKIVTHVYQFLRLWILSKYNNNLQIPTITKDIISAALAALSIRDNRGGKPKGDNLI